MRRPIDVTTEVFHLIWSNWRDGDIDEDSILRRLLSKLDGSSNTTREHLRGVSHASLVTGTAAATDEAEPGGLDIGESKEENHYEEEASEVTGGNFRMLPDIGKIRWVDDVRSALIALGGEAELSRIYDKTEEVRKAAGRSIVRSLDATVRQTIEAHSSDSRNFKPGNADHFIHVGRGRWRLRR